MEGNGGGGGMVALGGARGGGGRRRSFPFTLLPFLLPLFFAVFCYLHQCLYHCLPSDYIMCPFNRNSKCIRDIDRVSRRLCFSFPRTASNQSQEKKVLKKKVYSYGLRRKQEEALQDICCRTSSSCFLLRSRTRRRPRIKKRGRDYYRCYGYRYMYVYVYTTLYRSGHEI